MRGIVKVSWRPPAQRGHDRDGGFPWPSGVGAPALRCPASPRRARLTEHHGNPSLWVFIVDPWYYAAGPGKRHVGAAPRPPYLDRLGMRASP